MTVPSLAQADLAKGEVKAIAEEAFIYGFPMVMNYGTMYEYAIDTASSQYKAPFNRISNTARVFTPHDTAIVTPNSDTPYSFLWMDLRVEPVVLPSRRSTRGGTSPSNSSISTRTTTATSALAPRATRRQPTWSPVLLEGRDTEGHRQGDPLRNQVLAGGIPPNYSGRATWTT